MAALASPTTGELRRSAKEQTAISKCFLILNHFILTSYPPCSSSPNHQVLYDRILNLLIKWLDFINVLFKFFNVLSKQLKDRVYANIGLKALFELFRKSASLRPRRSLGSFVSCLEAGVFKVRKILA